MDRCPPTTTRLTARGGPSVAGDPSRRAAGARDPARPCRARGLARRALGQRAVRDPGAEEALLTAATHHDDGWLELDGRPMYNAEQRRPAHFIELPLTETVGPYGRGVESVYARDVHAGALVPLHFSGLYTTRWGVGGGAPSGNELAQAVVATQEARWMPALREAWGYRGRRSDFDAATWHAYEVLQAVDLLSLAHGLIDLERPAPHGEPVDVTTTLARTEQVPGPAGRDRRAATSGRTPCPDHGHRRGGGPGFAGPVPVARARARVRAARARNRRPPLRERRGCRARVPCGGRASLWN